MNIDNPNSKLPIANSAGNSADDSIPPSPARASARLPLIAVSLAVAAMVLSGWLWWQGLTVSGEADMQAARLEQVAQQAESRTAELANRIAGLEADRGAGAEANRGTEQRWSELERRIVELESERGQWRGFRSETAASTRGMQTALEGAQARLARAEARISALATREGNSAAELNLAEVDYVLRLAQERLQLFSDTRTADQALQIAETHIAAFDHPMYLALLREIGAARQKLTQFSATDYAHIFQALDALQAGLAQLPFKGRGDLAPPASGADEEGWWARVRQAVSGLVTVRRTVVDDSSLPVVADQEVIRQRAWLTLEMARLAALRREQPSYAAALQQFEVDIERWFEAGSREVASVRKAVDELRALDVDPAMPDISAPWTALQSLKGQGVSQAEADTGEADIGERSE